MESRERKAIELFNSGAVKRVDKNKWQVTGSRIYTVKKLDHYTYTCNCEDHLFRFETCKHMRAAKLKEQEARTKGFKRQENFFNNKLKNLQMKKRAIKEQINKILQQNKEFMKSNGAKSDELRKKAHRQQRRLREVEEELKKYSSKPQIVLIG